MFKRKKYTQAEKELIAKHKEQDFYNGHFATLHLDAFKDVKHGNKK